MKSKIIIFSLIFSVYSNFFFSCEKSTELSEKEAVLAIDVEWAFENDSIKVELNNELLLQRRVTTNYSVSAAWISGPNEYPSGNYTVQFEIFDFDLQDKYKFYLKDTLTVLIRFDREDKKIQFSTYDGIILRD
jgi:hypothetical protein